ncbi:oligosaccharide flippase family protein, partial [Escherichia coli]|nr:oligosaccharide flippase family protein [Escherichia coli]
LYTTLPALVIGVVLGNVNLAYYNIALTIRNALLGLFNPISQSLFPRVNNLYSIDQNRAYKLIKQSLIVVAVIFIFLAITTNIMSDFIVNKILGHSEFIVVSLVKMICFIPAISAINNILGIQTIILHGYKKLFSTVTIFYGVLNCIIIYPSLIYFGVIGAIYSSIFIELLIFITLALIVLQKKLLVAA